MSIGVILKEYRDEPGGKISIVDKDEKPNTVHICYYIGSKWWHKGIASEAFAGIIPFIFEQVKANRIESQPAPKIPIQEKS